MYWSLIAVHFIPDDTVAPGSMDHVLSRAPPTRSNTQQGFQQMLADRWSVSQLEMELRPKVDPQQCCAMVVTATFKALPVRPDPCPVSTLHPQSVPSCQGWCLFPQWGGPQSRLGLIVLWRFPPYLDDSSPRNPWGSPPCQGSAQRPPSHGGFPHRLVSSPPPLCSSPLFWL